WVRKSNDGLSNQDHENPVYRRAGSPNYVYVRVRNRGCGGTGAGNLNLYWAKASTGLSWPSPWDGSVTVPALMGGMIGSQSVSVAARDDEIFVFPWMPPNPADYASIGADKSHFCLLARIETSATAPYGMTFPETTDLYANVKNNNNIAWKNITVLDTLDGARLFGSVVLANFRSGSELATLAFLAERDGLRSILDWGQVCVELPPALRKRLSGEIGDATAGIRRRDGRRLELLARRTKLGPIQLAPGEMHSIGIEVIPRKQRRALGARVLTLDIMQEVKGHVIGGQRLALRTAPDRRRIVIDRAVNVFDGVSWVPRGDSAAARKGAPRAVRGPARYPRARRRA